MSDCTFLPIIILNLKWWSAVEERRATLIYCNSTKGLLKLHTAQVFTSTCDSAWVPGRKFHPDNSVIRFWQDLVEVAGPLLKCDKWQLTMAFSPRPSTPCMFYVYQSSPPPRSPVSEGQCYLIQEGKAQLNSIWKSQIRFKLARAGKYARRFGGIFLSLLRDLDSSLPTITPHLHAL